MTIDELKRSCRTVYGAQTEAEFGERLAVVLMTLAADPIENPPSREFVQRIQKIRDDYDRTRTPAPSQRMTFSVPLTPQTHTSGHVPLMQSALSPEQFNEYVGTIKAK